MHKMSERLSKPRKEAKPPRDPRTYSLTFTLALSFGTLTFLAVVVVLFISLSIASRNTIELTREMATLGVDTVVGRVERHLSPARAQLEHLDGAIRTKRINLDGGPEFQRYFEASLAAAPQIAGIVFINNERQLIGIERRKTGFRVNREDLSKDPRVAVAVAQARGRKAAFWGAPFWSRDEEETFINLRRPVFRDGKFAGMLVAVVRISELSEFLQRLAGSLGGGTPFILYDRNYVLAHPGLTSGFPGRSDTKPLPTLKDYADRIIMAIWDPAVREEMAIKLAPPYKNHSVVLGDDYHFFFYRELQKFGQRPWQVGLHVPQETVAAQFKRLVAAAVAGLLAMVLSVLAAIWLGRRVARPVKRIAEAANKIAAFRLDEVAVLGGSRIRELNAQANAFNTMLGGLRWFEAYVPKRLVERLMSRGEAGAPPSRERDLTIMFTDIAGYTSLSEGRDADEVAAFLNDHFARVAACIEAEEGTVDKFIGDSVMAFWGAPDKQKNRAIRACRAALAIRQAIAEDNKARIAAGAPPIRMRIGLHSGLVTVGNIGAPGRLNYTIVGDAVNVASRIEGQGREYAIDDEAVTILISGETQKDLDASFDTIRVGEASVRGRTAPVELYRLA